MKKLIIVMIIIVLLISSCEKSPQSENQNTTENDETVNESEPSKYTAQGKIIKIDENGLHVQDKDKVDIYNVDPERTSNLFVGEYVGINKLEGDKFDVVLDGNHDYNIRMTTEGKLVKRISGTVGEVLKDSFTAITESDEIKLSKTMDFDLNTGDQIIADYVELAGSNEMLTYFDEATRINANVKEVSRDTNGMMRIYALSENKIEYDIMVRAETITNFIHSSLKPDDKIIVYPDNISGDIPATVDAKLIILSNEEA